MIGNEIGLLLLAKSVVHEIRRLMLFLDPVEIPLKERNHFEQARTRIFFLKDSPGLENAWEKQVNIFQKYQVVIAFFSGYSCGQTVDKSS